MILQIGVKAFLKNKQGKYLLLKRSLVKYPEIKIHRWDIVGGRIDAGVDLFKNLQREVFEETGLRLKKKPRLLSAQDILRIPGKHIVRITYMGEIEGNPKIDPEEHEDFKWVTLEELKKKRGLDIYVRQILPLIA